ncbi:hypothetical protein PG993_000880 [Apiospora rasikravindrae]|uniref:Uncharacterized protein n=1 Tax=Apiospora rasikravindrae TaxID=990691 RepID=A0ABR1UCH2_9PEZI
MTITVLRIKPNHNNEIHVEEVEHNVESDWFVGSRAHTPLLGEVPGGPAAGGLDDLRHRRPSWWSCPHFTRLSGDEIIHERHGLYGVDYPADDALYQQYQEENDAIILQRFHSLLEEGQDIVLDRSFYAKEDRDEFKRIVEEHGGPLGPRLLQTCRQGDVVGADPATERAAQGGELGARYLSRDVRDRNILLPATRGAFRTARVMPRVARVPSGTARVASRAPRAVAGTPAASRMAVVFPVLLVFVALDPEVIVLEGFEMDTVAVVIVVGGLRPAGLGPGGGYRRPVRMVPGKPRRARARANMSPGSVDLEVAPSLPAARLAVADRPGAREGLAAGRLLQHRRRLLLLLPKGQVEWALEPNIDHFAADGTPAFGAPHFGRGAAIAAPVATRDVAGDVPYRSIGSHRRQFPPAAQMAHVRLPLRRLRLGFGGRRCGGRATT